MAGAAAAAARRRSLVALLLAASLACLLTYATFSPAMWASTARLAGDEATAVEEGRCCRGMEGLELWGPVVKWGADHRVDSPAACCAACKTMCPAAGGRCLCDSWVFCGDKERCKDRFGECWLKKQDNVMVPAVVARGENVMWTSGLIFGKGEGIVGLETNHGTIRIKLLPDCAPHSVTNFTELLGLHHCAGCGIYRAEDRGDSWDFNGNHITNAPFGPPYALLQGTLKADGVPFEKIPLEGSPTIRRGSVGWLGSGPEFFISLANHHEWKNAYTVFGSVLPEDMEIAERMALLPTKTDVRSNITVLVLDDPVYFKVRSYTNSKV